MRRVPGSGLAVLLLAIMGGSCAREPAVDTAQAELPFELPVEARPIGLAAGSPRLQVAGVELEDGAATTERFVVASGAYLEFVPALLASIVAEPPIVETVVEVHGVETVVDRSPARRRQSFRGAAGVRSLLAPVRVDLDPFHGQSVRIAWRIAAAAGNAGAALAPRVAAVNPRLLVAGIEPRPDILLICSDTHRHDYALTDTGADLMPALASLLDESVVYARSYSTASWTMPSIASALTGLFSRFHGVGHVAGTTAVDDFDPETVPPGQFAFKAGGKIRLLSTYSDEIRSLPETLRRAGYTTVIAAGNPLYFLSGLALDGTDVAIDAAVLRSQAINEATFAALETADSERPLFLLVHYMDVHHWKQWFFESAADRDSDAYRNAVIASYRQGARETDAAIAALLGRWQAERGPGAIVVFYSDHGEHLMDPHDPKRLGHGNTMDDVLLHVPLAIRYPESMGIEARTVEAEASLADITPTLLDVLGLPPGDAHSLGTGRSLVSATTAEPRTLFADFQLYGKQQSVARAGDAKLVLHFDEDRVELVDARTGEPRNGSGEDGPARELMRAFRAYDEAATRHREGLVFDREIDQDEAMRNLEALGYVN